MITAYTDLGTCTRGCPAPAEVPWSGERLCWDCADRELDLVAKAVAEDTPVQVGGFGLGNARPAEDRLVEEVAQLYLHAAGGDPELAMELVRESEYLKGEAA